MGGFSFLSFYRKYKQVKHDVDTSLSSKEVQKNGK